MDNGASGAAEPNPEDYRRGYEAFIDMNNTQQSYARMRAECPVVMSGGIAYISRYADIDHGLRDPSLFGSTGRANLGNSRPLIPIDFDPPEHSRYRRILDPMFSPKQMARLQPAFTELTNSMIDAFIDRGSCEFVSEFAFPLPGVMFLSMLGLPTEDLPILLELNHAVMRPPTEGDVQDHMRAWGQRFYDYFEDHLARRGTGGGAIIDQLLEAEYEGKRLSHEEILDTLFMFTLAGLDTVASTLECFFAYLAVHPEHRRQLSQDPAVVPSAVEELLRYEGSVLFSVKAAMKDVTLQGVEIPKGSPVAFVLSSASLDEAVFENPNVVDFAREPNRHMGFGRGIHRCLGSHLARLELRVALQEFHRRIPHYEIAPGTVLHWAGTGMKHVSSLPLVFPPGGRA